ncbi:MAG: hypothetical protein HPY50_12780 [Firmicutes bacterium]|nr:hypothetical protein [Bacillota bacterium]
MKNIVLVASILVVIGVILSVCGANVSSQPPVNPNDLKPFTSSELEKYNGQGGNPAYVAVDGIIYDVTKCKSWENGIHKGYQAGNDLSKEFGLSPHRTSVLKNLSIVGKLVD